MPAHERIALSIHQQFRKVTTSMAERVGLNMAVRDVLELALANDVVQNHALHLVALVNCVVLQLELGRVTRKCYQNLLNWDSERH